MTSKKLIKISVAFFDGFRYNIRQNFSTKEESHVRPCKTPAGKARRSKAQRARLVKFGMKEEDVKLMGDEEVRVLVQRPTVVKKILAKKA